MVDTPTLTLLVVPDGTSWFVQGIEIDYAAQGRTLDEAMVNFLRGLELTFQLYRQHPLSNQVPMRNQVPIDVWDEVFPLSNQVPIDVWDEVFSHPSSARREARQMIDMSSLPKLHTKVLLNALRSTRASESRRLHKLHYREPGEPVGPLVDDVLIVQASLLGGKYSEDSTVMVSQLKAELGKRPHVPNKHEAKAIRQAKAKRARSRS